MKTSLAGSKPDQQTGAVPVLDRVLAAFRITGPRHAVTPVFGVIPEDVRDEDFASLCNAKPQMRKSGAFLSVVVPVRVDDGGEPQAWVGYTLGEVPAVTELPRVIADLQATATKFEQAQDADTPARDTTQPSALVLSRIAGAGRLKPAALRQVMVETLASSDAASSSFIADLRPVFRSGGVQTRRGVRGLVVSDRAHLPQADEIRHLMAARQGPEPIKDRVHRNDISDVGLDPALMSDRLNADEILVDVPAQGNGGLGFVVLDPQPGLEDDLDALRHIYDVARRRKGQGWARARRLIMRGSILAVVAAAVVYLALPAPLRISATALSAPTNAVTAALPIEASVGEILISVGDVVTEGQVLARFGSRDLEDQRAEAQLRLGVEELTSRAALSENDYGNYVQSQQKMATEQRRLAQIERRLDALTILAPVSGRVVTALPRNTVGAFRPKGEEVAVLQPDREFDVSLDIARVDAPLLAVGQTGSVYFRGLAGDTFGLELTEPVAITRDASSGAERLTARAKVQSGDNLIVGLSGYAKLDVGQASRAYVWSRYIIEYAKQKAWIYLDWRL